MFINQTILWLHLVTPGYRRLYMFISGYTRLLAVTSGYTWLQSVTYIQVHLVRCGYTWLHIGTPGYTRLDVVILGYICYTRLYVVTVINYIFKVQQLHLITFSNVLVPKHFLCGGHYIEHCDILFRQVCYNQLQVWHRVNIEKMVWVKGSTRLFIDEKVVWLNHFWSTKTGPAGTILVTKSGLA